MWSRYIENLLHISMVMAKLVIQEIEPTSQQDVATKGSATASYGKKQALGHTGVIIQ